MWFAPSHLVFSLDIKCLPRVEAFSSTHFFHMNLLSFQRQAFGMFPFQGCGIIICKCIAVPPIHGAVLDSTGKEQEDIELTFTA